MEPTSTLTDGFLDTGLHLFVTMRDRNLQVVLPPDRDVEQAGFTALLRP